MKDWVLIFCFVNFCVMLIGVSLPLWLLWWDDLHEDREKKQALPEVGGAFPE